MTDARNNLDNWPDPALMWLLAVLLAALLSLCSCSPRVVEHLTVQRDTTYIERTQIDSVFRRDSVFVREKGDTVFVYQERVREHFRFIHDTVSVVKVDSVAFERIKEVEVVQPIPKIQQAKIRAFWWLLAGLCAALLWIFRKPIMKLIKLI